jgi:hypothetical protein
MCFNTPLHTQAHYGVPLECHKPFMGIPRSVLSGKERHRFIFPPSVEEQPQAVFMGSGRIYSKFFGEHNPAAVAIYQRQYPYSEILNHMTDANTSDLQQQKQLNDHIVSMRMQGLDVTGAVGSRQVKQVEKQIVSDQINAESY